MQLPEKISKVFNDCTTPKVSAISADVNLKLCIKNDEATTKKVKVLAKVFSSDQKLFTEQSKVVWCWCVLVLTFAFYESVWAHDELHVHYEVSSKWKHLADGRHAIGKSHGEIDVADDGTFYLSVLGDKNIPGGIKKYSPEGEFIGQVPNAPTDFHSMVIVKEKDGNEYIYGAGMYKNHIIKMTLDGKIIHNVNGLNSIPNQYHRIAINKKNKKPYPKLRLSGIAIDKQGYWYVVDGYGLDYIHKFSPNGKYLTSFGGRNPPYEFNNCHKIHIDPRFNPNRLMCTDRVNGRIVHMDLDGSVIGEFASGLRRPSGVAFYNDIAAVAEISGRVSLLDKTGKIIKSLGTNDLKNEINTNKTHPDRWEAGLFTAPHGITFDENGDLFITEWNKWGRIVRYDVK